MIASAYYFGQDVRHAALVGPNAIRIKRHCFQLCDMHYAYGQWSGPTTGIDRVTTSRDPRAELIRTNCHPSPRRDPASRSELARNETSGHTVLQREVNRVRQRAPRARSRNDRLLRTRSYQNSLRPSQHAAMVNGAEAPLRSIMMRRRDVLRARGTMEDVRQWAYRLQTAHSLSRALRRVIQTRMAILTSRSGFWRDNHTALPATQTNANLCDGSPNSRSND